MNGLGLHASACLHPSAIFSSLCNQFIPNLSVRLHRGRDSDSLLLFFHRSGPWAQRRRRVRQQIGHQIIFLTDFDADPAEAGAACGSRSETGNCFCGKQSGEAGVRVVDLRHARRVVGNVGSRRCFRDLPPCHDVALRMGVYRTTTGHDGSAALELPRGTYEVTAWKTGYELATTTADVAGNTTIELSLVALPVQQEEYWM